MNNFKVGMACIVDSKSKLVAVLTDGDLRRTILSTQKPLSALFVDDVKDYCTKIYSSIKPDTDLKSAIIFMEELIIQLESCLKELWPL